MTHEVHDDELRMLAGVRTTLERSAIDLDPAIALRLAQARAAAVAHAAETRPRATGRSWQWLVPAAGAVASAVLVLAFWYAPAPAPQGDAPLQAVDFEILSSADNLDLMKDLEFYRWLEAQDVQAH
jgi:hypothetical protein